MQIKKLSDLFDNYADLESGVQTVTKVTSSSNEVIPGSVFFAIKGDKADGNKFIPQAIEKGAIAIVTSDPSKVLSQIPLIISKDVRAAYSLAQARFFSEPSRDLRCLAVTGTNGKTSVSWILLQALLSLGEKTAYCGTLGIAKLNNLAEAVISNVLPLDNTTPDASKLQSLIAESVNEKTNNIVFEVSSHALDQKRVANINWDLAIFTNLTQDHLDYHQTMKAYGEAKKLLFTKELVQSSKKQKVAVVNLDDELGREIIAEIKPDSEIKMITFSPSGASADLKLIHSHLSPQETILKINIFGQELEFKTNLIGLYNLENTLACFAALSGLGYPLAAITESLAKVKTVPGRLERVASVKRNIFVDYAHTPDALIQVQKSLKRITAGKLYSVFGCGGDRDKTKRPLMGRAVSEYSDFAIVTSDNPRSEVPISIIEDILKGIPASYGYEVEEDRRKAIEKVIAMTTVDDVILIAGKGHEDYQIIQGVKHKFSDVEVALDLLKGINSQSN